MVCDAVNCNSIEASKITNSFEDFKIITKLCEIHTLKFKQYDDSTQKIIYIDQSHGGSNN